MALPLFNPAEAVMSLPYARLGHRHSLALLPISPKKSLSSPPSSTAPSVPTAPPAPGAPSAPSVPTKSQTTTPLPAPKAESAEVEATINQLLRDFEQAVLATGYDALLDTLSYQCYFQGERYTRHVEALGALIQRQTAQLPANFDSRQRQYINDRLRNHYAAVMSRWNDRIFSLPTHEGSVHPSSLIRMATFNPLETCLRRAKQKHHSVEKDSTEWCYPFRYDTRNDYSKAEIFISFCLRQSF